MGDPIGAYSESTNTHYDSWDDLVAAEANGYIVTAVLHRGKQTWTWSIGPYDDQRLANNAKQRLKTRIKKERDSHPDTELVVITIRPLWKDPR
jgi:hypothetical protein